MISSKYIELMNQEYDGANSPQQSRELEEFLESSQEARDYFRELGKALNVFDEAGLLDPPPQLGEDILTWVDDRLEPAAATPMSGGRKGIGTVCRDLFTLRLEPAYAFTFLAGLVLGLGLFAASSWLTSRHGTDLYDDVRGTANHGSWDLAQVSEGELDLPGLSGHYRTLRDGNDLKLRLKLRTTQPTEIKFLHDQQTILQHYSSSNPVPANLAVSDAMVKLNHMGRGSYDLVFRQDLNNKSQITMSIFSEGRLVKTEILEKKGQ